MEFPVPSDVAKLDPCFKVWLLLASQLTRWKRRSRAASFSMCLVYLIHIYSTPNILFHKIQLKTRPCFSKTSTTPDQRASSALIHRGRPNHLVFCDAPSIYACKPFKQVCAYTLKSSRCFTSLSAQHDQFHCACQTTRLACQVIRIWRRLLNWMLARENNKQTPASLSSSPHGYRDSRLDGIWISTI